jgi:hypothetical protein
MFSMLMESDDLIIMYQAKTTALGAEVSELKEKLAESQTRQRALEEENESLRT